MPLSEAADIADVFALVGVIVSLIYVGYQVRETRKAVRAATAQARTELGVHLITSRFTTDIAELLVKSLEDAESLTKVDEFKLKSFFSAHVRHSHNLFYQHKEGLLDDYFSFGIARTSAYWIRNYAWAASEWMRVKQYMPADFVAFINSELEHHSSRYDA